VGWPGWVGLVGWLDTEMMRMWLEPVIEGLVSTVPGSEFQTADIPLSSDRQHLSYDVCLEVRGEIIRTVLCCIVYWSCAQSEAHLDEQFLQFSGLCFVIMDLFLFICVYFVCFCFILHSCCIIPSTVGWTWWDWSLILRTCPPSVLWHCWLGHLTRKNSSLIWPIMCLVGR